MTIRNSQQITSIGLATCGKGGSRLAARLGIRTTRQTILRRIMELPDPPAESILFRGIDDFAFLRGRRYGTILVNLETRHVVDLLPDRKAETSASWMRHYPDLMAVSRDRGGDYAAAATAGAPQATQCADRFHVIKNLGEAQDGRAGASSGCPSDPPDSGVKSHPALHCATRAAAEIESKGSTAKPGEARGAPGPIPCLVVALRKQGLSQTAEALAGGDRPCHGLALVGKFRVSRTTTTAAQDWS